MSKITNRSGTGYSCTHMATVGVKGLTDYALSASVVGFTLTTATH